MGLSNKQQAFIDAYLISWNATDAARRAGYSEKSARVIGSENLTKPDISAEIKRRIDANAMSANEVLARLAEHARGDIGEFMELTATAVKATGNSRLIRRFSRTTTVTTTANGLTESESISLELYDAQSALDKLGRHHKLFTDKAEISRETVGYTLDEWRTEQRDRQRQAGQAIADFADGSMDSPTDDPG